MNIIITGASKGIGRAIANIFAAQGYTLFICSRNEVSLYKTVESILGLYPNATIHAKPTDMANQTEVKAFADWVLSKTNFIDILINNAGQFLPGSIYNEEEGLLEKMIATNLYSAYHFTRYLLPNMMLQKSGHIFNICSIASLNAYSNGGSYSISKFALLGFSKNLREEMKPYGIKVTAVMPGATLSASWDGFDIDPTRIMEINDVAKMVFAASQLSPQAVVEDIILRPQLGDL